MAGHSHTRCHSDSRKIVGLRMARPEPAVTTKLHRCPVRRGVPRNEKANDWAKLAADEPDAHGVEVFSLVFLCYFLGALDIFVTSQGGEQGEPQRAGRGAIEVGVGRLAGTGRVCILP